MQTLGRKRFLAWMMMFLAGVWIAASVPRI